MGRKSITLDTTDLFLEVLFAPDATPGRYPCHGFSSVSALAGVDFARSGHRATRSASTSAAASPAGGRALESYAHARLKPDPPCRAGPRQQVLGASS